MHLKNWKARRAGARITITGTDTDGNPAKIVGVDAVEPGPRGSTFCTAKDKLGEEHTLSGQEGDYFWQETGISFGTAMECGDFLTSQGFNCCDGGYEKTCDLGGGRIFASYVLTKRRCYLRVLYAI